MSRQKNKLRIIGGQYRSRVLAFIDAEGLRPTLDRVRETLFNWLAQPVIGANCLDLFAGSGALGFEAVSRGAGSLTMVENNARVVQQLKANSHLLQLDGVQVVRQKAQQFIQQTKEKFDIVFVDPPFAMADLVEIPQKLEQAAILSDNALIYLECASRQKYTLPDNWQVLKQKKSGDVFFQLAQRRA